MKLKESFRRLVEILNEEPTPCKVTESETRLYEFNEVVAIVSEFVWRDVEPLDNESPEEYRLRLNEYAEEQVLAMMYAPSRK